MKIFKCLFWAAFEGMEILAAPWGFVSHVSRSAEQSEKRRHEGQGFNQPVVIR